ncbi:unnamed protein product [Amoebophrya sp. A25]|nr:unnamed protein product [Amoebophrya sp. A25]|eukprot:GSA25T00000312001.1
MAYVASWRAPLGSIMGAQNMPQEPRNAENINETFRRNETVGYFKPPFCQWPYGGTSKKEAKQRLKGGEPVVKAGSYEFEPAGNDFYFRNGAFAKPKDEDEISIRTESTTLYLGSNLCTRTFGPHQNARPLPGKAVRAKFESRPYIPPYVVPESMKNYDAKINVFDNVKRDGVRSPTRPQGGSKIFLPGEISKQIVEHCNAVNEVIPQPRKEDRPRPPEPLIANRTRLPRSYKVGGVPKVTDTMGEEGKPEPSWRKNDSRVLISPRTYLNATSNIVRHRSVEEMFEPNDDVLYFD